MDKKELDSIQVLFDARMDASSKPLNGIKKIPQLNRSFPATTSINTTTTTNTSSTVTTNSSADISNSIAPNTSGVTSNSSPKYVLIEPPSQSSKSGTSTASIVTSNNAPKTTAKAPKIIHRPTSRFCPLCQTKTALERVSFISHILSKKHRKKDFNTRRTKEEKLDKDRRTVHVSGMKSVFIGDFFSLSETGVLFVISNKFFFA